MLFTRDGHNVFLGDMLRGCTAFLICAGPSLLQHDLSRLQQRGILTCAVNNAATVVRPSLWVSVDDPGNFCDVIWKDPGIWKFVPLCHMEKPFTVRTAAGELVPSTELVGDMPSVFGYRRNEAFDAEQWLFEDTFNWGNHSQRVDAHGIKGSRSVMLIALRLLFYLGVRRIYLLGCDFQMTFGAQNYAFDQERTRSSVSGNNGTYHALNIRLGALLPHFKREGLEIFNCTPNSGLRVFPSCDYETAVQDALSGIPRQAVTSGMYERNAKSHGQSNTDVPRDRPSISYSEGKPIDPVESLDIPGITLVTAVDRTNIESFRWTWQSWMYFRGLLRKSPLLIIHDPDEALQNDIRSIVKDHLSARLIDAQPEPQTVGRNRWSHAYIRVAAQETATDWYLRLEPEAVACQADYWLLQEWFQKGQENPGLAFASHPWGYTKPSNALALLDDWGDTVDGLKCHPSLQVPFRAEESQVNHDAISSWFFLGNTAWTRELLNYVPQKLPCSSHDTFMLYCALRRRDSFVRYSMKALGWDHSFSRGWSPVKQARAVLEAAKSALNKSSCLEVTETKE